MTTLSTGNLFVDYIPDSLRILDQFVLWKIVGEGKKTPCCQQGVPVGYADELFWKSFAQASSIASEVDDIGLGFSLRKDGTQVKRKGVTWNLCVFDFDGFFYDGDPFELDENVDEFLDDLETYVEISPSGTGFKAFFWTDKEQTKKSKVKFGPSKFAERFPDVRKYQHREIEVFFQGYFMTVTGDRLYDWEDLAFIPEERYDSLMAKIIRWGNETGGANLKKLKASTQAPAYESPFPLLDTLDSYAKLEPQSLETVLKYVDHFDETVWSDTSNAVARVYGESGREYFMRYSRGDYSQVKYPEFDLSEVEERYDRALEEVDRRDHGYGVKHLIESAGAHKDWDFPSLKYVESEVSKAELPTSSETELSPLEHLKSFSVLGLSQQLRDSLLNDTYALQDIAILGQWTTIYGQYGSGKTLLMLWLLRESIQLNNVKGDNVYYVNADDTFRGGLEKLELAEEFGMHVFLPSQQGFSEKYLVPLMTSLVASDEAQGVVLILDTLKKFTNLMDKGESSSFGKVARSFVQARGTLICLAHTNKHKDGEGKSIYEGTGDIVNDADCVYTLEKVSTEDSGLDAKRYTVEFNNTKARGDVAPNISFEYEKLSSSNANYSSILHSVKRLDNEAADAAKKNAELSEMFAKDEEIINAISDSIRNGSIAKGEIIVYAKSRTEETKSKIGNVLSRYCGNDWGEGKLWSMNVGPNNRNEYQLLPSP
jgi:hypothetical protein